MTELLQTPETGDEEESEGKTEDESQENGAALGSDAVSSTSSTPLLRPSSFKPHSSSSGPGTLAPGRLNNPFETRTAAGSTAPVTSSSDSAASAVSEGAGAIGSTTLASNPFAAARVNPHSVSSSSDNDADKPIVGPAHFTPQSLGATAAATEAAESNVSSRIILRPSALDKQTANFSKTLLDNTSAQKTSFKLEPAKLQSPLATSKQIVSPSDKTVPNDTKRQDDTLADKSSGDASSTNTRHAGSTDSRTTGGATSLGFGTPSSNLFSQGTHEALPSKSQNGSFEGQTDACAGAGFLFGESMKDRVKNTAPTSGFVFGEQLTARAEVPSGAASTSTDSRTGSNSTSKNTTKPASEEVAAVHTLEESAAAEQAKRTKVALEEVEVKTGEEDEYNVFQINAKLYVFQKESQSWIERGRGLLRLNDMSNTERQSFQSRLVMRTQGSLRVVLNTKVFAGMTIDRASPKSVRLTALDEDGLVKIFLIVASPNDADQIFKAIDWRVQQLHMKEQKRESEGGKHLEASASSSSGSMTEKRPVTDSPEDSGPSKKVRVESVHRKDAPTEESNDSSTVDPETEGGVTELVCSLQCYFCTAGHGMIRQAVSELGVTPPSRGCSTTQYSELNTC
ncbi:hypothetical protein NP493_2g16015 [Ridgeia piscesae]|uniref:RanBD1 domain-containing protein n=1 Tax=Ridgeia piscesae TaxID=27915 RepID=A0AAD9ULY9_RIDPI|nr:hypothetical protein NP493_2g16015 [Ridgeia piscesae]